jgi:hypothetical protein
MIITGAMMATAGVGALGAIGNFIGGNAKANAENRARIKQYKQQMLIRDVRDQQRFGAYNTKKVGYKQSLKALDTQFAAQETQDNLQMNELLKGSKVASQNKLVNEVQTAGKIAARGSGGASSAKLKQSALAALGRQAQIREDQMVSSVYAKQMKDDAQRLSLDAAKQREFNKVRFAPQMSPVQEMGAMVDGPSPFSLVAGIGQAALGGLAMGQSNAGFEKEIMSSNPNNVQVPSR